MVSKKEKEEIRAAVQLAESMTSGEIVPMLVPASGFYLWVDLLWALLGASIASLLVVFWQNKLPWTSDLWELVVWQCAGLVVGYTVASIPGIKRLSLSSSFRQRQVHLAAMAAFLNEGVAETRDRSGILIYISALEHRVEIVADAGIHKKLGQDFWRGMGEQITEGIRQGRTAAVLVQVITQMGILLQQHFPRHENDSNELCNELRGPK